MHGDKMLLRHACTIIIIMQVADQILQGSTFRHQATRMIIYTYPITRTVYNIITLPIKT
jgi:hypothetical protein